MATYSLKIYSIAQSNYIDAITLTQVTVDLTLYGITIATHETIGGLIYNNKILSVSGITIQPYETVGGLIQGTMLTII